MTFLAVPCVDLSAVWFVLQVFVTSGTEFSDYLFGRLN